MVTKIIASGAAGQPDGKCGSVTEPEEHDVAVLNDVFLAFGPGESLFPGWFPSPHSNEVIVGHRLRSNEPLLEIGVDHAGRSGGFVAPVNGPGTHFLLSGGEVALESEQVIGRVSQTIQLTHSPANPTSAPSSAANPRRCVRLTFTIPTVTKEYVAS